MELPRLFDELVRAAEKVGVEVRVEAFEQGLREAKVPRGGLCTVRGRRVVLVDDASPLPDRIAMVASALAELDLERVYLPPIVRATIGVHQRQRIVPPRDREPLPLARARRRS